MKLMMRIATMVVLAALCLPVLSLAARAAEENPLKNANVGDWIEFVMSTEAMGQKMEMQMKQSVTAKDATFVTLRMETTMLGQQMPGQDVKIPLDTPYEPYTQGLADAKVTVLGEGNETLSVGGKSYACHWTKVKVVATKPQAAENTAKVWTCKDVPVNGLVRMESEGTTTMEGQAMTTKMSMELKGASGE
jgi:hypothetical protein